ncbi:hypothetical protein MET9862_03385 [Methylobacterium symbioticum]|uniref:Uncharacterized protein n=1 Tax=Methylobacterium symbioticum TaxID=2584084 RepID=A0A509EET6_9HYPH|nr:hypothetical protein MET9862_03385 [Methylobacterium symbioticum]
MVPGSDAEMLALVNEIIELRLQLAEAQDQCVEMAVDAGHLLAEIHDLRRELAAARSERVPGRIAA